MQLFEVMLAGGLALLIAAWAGSAPGRVLTVVGAVSVPVLTALHLAAEGYRWQMIPVYGVAGGMAALAVSGALGVPGRPVRRMIGAAAMALVLGAGALPSALLPVFRVPPPDGPHAVGTLVFQATDASREEHYTDAAGDRREIAIQVWYPSEDVSGAGAPWLERPDLHSGVLSAQVGMPPFFFDHVGAVRTNAIEGAPVAEGGPFPVLVYSHGWNAWRGINTDQVETLASHGYVVIVPEHAYGANLSIHPDGRAIYNLPSIVPDREEVGDEAYFASIRRLVDTYAGDIRFCLDKAAEWQAAGGASPFGGKLDLARIGVFGHSTGGGAVAEAMAEDDRIQAACAMDLWALPVSDDLLEAPKSTPFLGLESEVWSSDENTARIGRFLQSLGGDAWYGTIAGTRHNDFTVVPLTTPIAARLGLKGPLNGARVSEIVNGCLLEFFNGTLKGEPVSVLGGTAYPEVTWTSLGGELDVEGDAVGGEDLGPADGEAAFGGGG